MRNPFNFQRKDDADFARDKRARLNEITRLRIARSWSLLTLIPGTFMLMLVPFAGTPNALNVGLPVLCLVGMIVSCVQLNRQIKSLEAMKTERE